MLAVWTEGYRINRIRVSSAWLDTREMFARLPSVPTEHFVLGSNGSLVKMWFVSDRKEVSLAGHSNNVFSVAFSPDGQHIVSGSSDMKV